MDRVDRVVNRVLRAGLHVETNEPRLTAGQSRPPYQCQDRGGRVVMCSHSKYASQKERVKHVRWVHQWVHTAQHKAKTFSHLSVRENLGLSA